MKPQLEKDKFKHIYKVKVRFNEVDMLRILNNAVYFNYLEQARIHYVQDAGLLPPKGIFSDNRLYYMARNEINYLKPAFFDDELNIYTRISYIKKSSFGFEHIIERDRNNDVLAEGKGVLVHVDPVTKKSAPLPPEFYTKISAFDRNVEIIGQ
ncbi:acyl-CoA thioesterase [Melioribacteraceae bacterium 4301-Me]|uniref:acyl-CoA thioesterase n=1 Tax=Pyranulibacter aquaticus TaxID=3163344 RepID=UPI00359BA46B